MDFILCQLEVNLKGGTTYYIVPLGSNDDIAMKPLRGRIRQRRSCTAESLFLFVPNFKKEKKKIITTIFVQMRRHRSRST